MMKYSFIISSQYNRKKNKFLLLFNHIFFHQTHKQQYCKLGHVIGLHAISPTGKFQQIKKHPLFLKIPEYIWKVSLKCVYRRRDLHVNIGFIIDRSSLEYV